MNPRLIVGYPVLTEAGKDVCNTHLIAPVAQSREHGARRLHHFAALFSDFAALFSDAGRPPLSTPPGP